ncbi:MAG: hypothetical protein VZR53_01525 [Prevotella sp.]|nr:hypothetical protein [Prevotella sp.]
MTLAETRQLGIEFERRVQTMIPEAEFIGKLDTDTIYSFLNQYQDKYIHEIYRNLDNIPTGSKASAHVESILQSMLTSVELPASEAQDNTTGVTDPNGISIVDTARSITFTLPKDFYLYLRSVSKVSTTFSFKSTTSATSSAIRVIPNMLSSQNDVWKLIETPHDSLRILRYPAAVLNTYNDNKPTLSVIYDRYTTVEGIKVLYYKQPQHFDLMTSTPCELPMDAFDDLVSGAVDLYVQYAAGAEARKRQMQQEQQQ